MVNIRSNDSPNGSESPRVEIGEIDTRAPFQSVRAAVSLFGEVATKGKPAIRRNKSSSENVLDKETQLLLVQRETNKFKQVLEITEITKAKALGELDKAKKTVQELTAKLNKALDSKQLAMEATESVRNKATHLERVKSQNEAGIAAWKKELCTTRDQYREAAAELDAAKQELAKMRQDFDSALEAKTTAFQHAAEARRSAKINLERASELSDQIGMMRGSLEHLKATSGQAQVEQAKIVEEKEARLQAYKISKEEAERKITCLKEELINPQEVKVLESRLADMTEEIEAVQEEMKRMHVSDMDSAKSIMMDIDRAARALQKVADEEISCRNLIASLGKELENAKKERMWLEEQEGEIESAAMHLQSELQNSKSKLMEIPTRGDASGATHQERTSKMMGNSQSKAEDDEADAEEIRRAVEELKREAEKHRAAEQEAKRQLELALEEAKARKNSEKAMLERMKSMSAKIDAVDPSVSPARGWIKMPLQHFESMSRKVEESDNLAEMKLAAANFQMEAVTVKKSETENRVDAILKEIEEIKAATELALKQAEMAEAAKTAIEGELTKRRKNAHEADTSSIFED
ncbi:hypothetical protein MLD38_036720 [Melastoma candidum]|uniref:Uncharacterized protein n=1 Tax=Melastoma candidum TaxID=119954 RepID=A0ACB9LKZ6_9MYRT|nr:hypothetical protein MLD38_036720 [Melastoma candidum]